MIDRETRTPEIVTVPERKAREAARRRAAARDVMTEAREFATVRGGRFYVFGSVAEDRIKYDSDFDVVCGFPDRNGNGSSRIRRRGLSAAGPAFRRPPEIEGQ